MIKLKWMTTYIWHVKPAWHSYIVIALFVCLPCHTLLDIGLTCQHILGTITLSTKISREINWSQKSLYFTHCDLFSFIINSFTLPWSLSVLCSYSFWDFIKLSSSKVTRWDSPQDCLINPKWKGFLLRWQWQGPWVTLSWHLMSLVQRGASFWVNRPLTTFLNTPTKDV